VGVVKVSDLAYRRAVRMRLITEEEFDRQSFLEAIHAYLGCSGIYASEQCDEITSRMSDEDFKRLIDAIKRRFRKKIEYVAGVM
jgi:DNA-binding cell septation regulator SpoVG